ncbi:MAG: hypothetical protein NTV52_22185, partial [Acidobacteria bacterium]|nr:hypothetical protein [Acidobacteriota bacterium]
MMPSTKTATAQQGNAGPGTATRGIGCRTIAWRYCWNQAKRHDSPGEQERGGTPSVITPGPGKAAPNAAPTASEQVPANDGPGNAVNTKSEPAASRRLASGPSSIFRPIVR